MQQSYRSPRQPVRTRSKPYTRRQLPPRSGSIMATIRNIVTAPLSWFSTTDEFEDTPGKRRRAPVSQPNVDASDEHRSVKRQRVASPSPQTQGYLDPPPAMFQPRSKREGVSQDPTSTVPPSSTSMNPDTQDQPDKSGRHSLSATVWSRRDRSREVSMDNLPSRLVTRDATMIPLPVSREASLSSVPRDSSVGPVRASFRMRTTLSPIPVGSDYGPNPKRRERDPSEPPPLTALMSNPIFVKPPPNQHSAHRSQSAQPTTTLGALAQTSRAHNRIPPRQSSLHLNHPPPHDSSLRPINASEIALSELAIYRTPLLPTRLRGSETIPEMFKPKKVHAVVPMKSGKRDLPRLGTGRKKKKVKKEEDTRKPYSAHSSMKKLLQRRKMEEEAEKDHTDHAMDTSDAITGDGAPGSSSAAENVPTPLPEPDVPQHRVYARETSSLRVGRSRMGRPDRPTSVRPSRTKFSAAFEDDDPTDQKDQDAPRFETKPMFEPPRDFTFARDTTSAADAASPEPIKEPPIAVLPFSLTPEPSRSNSLAIPILPVPQPAVPVISLSPPTPQKNDSSAGIPNFFANSSLLARTSFTSTLPLPSGNLFGAPSVKEASQPTPPVTSDLTPLSTGITDFVETSGPPETTQSTFPPAPSVAAAPTFFSPPSAKVEPTPASTPAPFNGDPPKASFSASAPPLSVRPLPSFGDLPSHNSAAESTDAATTSVPSVTSMMESNPAAISSGQKGPTPSMFSFGNSSGTPFPGLGATNSAESLKPPIPEQPTPTPSPGESVKPPAVVRSEASKETKPAFSFAFKFGATSTSPEKSAAPQFGEPTQGASNPEIFTFGTSSGTVDAQKQLFGSFPRPVTPPREEEEVRMEESPTRVVEVMTPRQNEDSFFAGRTLNFGQSNGNTSSPFDFGTASGDSNPFGGKLEEKSKPPSGFAFGSSGPGFGQSSPAFTFGKVDNASQPATPSSPFTFGTSKLPEINTFGAGQTTTSSPFNFGPRPGSSQDPPGLAFGQQQSPVTTGSQFNFGQSQTLAPPPPSFGQQNGSVPSSPSTFNQPLSFGFGSATPTSTSNPFNFQSSSPITTTPSSAPGFAFGQQPPTQAQPSTPVSPFPVPGSPQPAGGSLFNIGAPPTVQSPGTRAIKKLPTRRGGARR